MRFVSRILPVKDLKSCRPASLETLDSCSLLLCLYVSDIVHMLFLCGACSRFRAGTQARYSGSSGWQQSGGPAEGRARGPTEWDVGPPWPRRGSSSCRAPGNICSHSHIIWPRPQGVVQAAVQNELQINAF